MRSVTDLRYLSGQGCGPEWDSRLQELESDCVATTFSLPSWVFNPALNCMISETEEQHRSRLDTLLVWYT